MITYWQSRVNAYRVDLAHIEEQMKTAMTESEINKLQQLKKLCKQELEVCLFAVAEFKEKEAG